jgi:hypothetical protein
MAAFEFTQQKKIADKIIDRERNEIGNCRADHPSLIVSIQFNGSIITNNITPVIKSNRQKVDVVMICPLTPVPISTIRINPIKRNTSRATLIFVLQFQRVNRIIIIKPDKAKHSAEKIN